MGDHVDIRVECYSGYKYGERPTVLYLEGDRFEIVDIENCWSTPDGNYFRVRILDGRQFVLSYSESLDLWRLE